MKKHPSKLKLGYFTDTYSPQVNGVSTSIDSFKQQLERSGHSVYIFAPRIPGQHEMPSVYRFPSVQSLAYPGIREALPFSPKILKAIPRLKLDLLHIQTPGQVGLLGTHLAIRYNLPTVFSYHTLYPEYFTIYRKATPSLILGLLAYPIIIQNPSAYSDIVKIVSKLKPGKYWTREIAEKLSVLYCNQSDGVIAPSAKIKKLLLKWGLKKPIAIIPTGLSLIDFEIKTKSIRPQYRLGQKDLVITFIGRIGQEKNLELLLDAFKLVAATSPKIKLLMIGDGPYRAGLVDQAKRLGISDRVTFTGFLKKPQIIAALKSSDIFVFPSLTDTQGIAVLEAAACGLPIVMIDREATDLVKDGVNGYFAKPKASDLAAKLMKLVESKDRREQFGAASKERVKQYTAEKMTEKLLNFYQKIIKQNRSKNAT